MQRRSAHLVPILLVLAVLTAACDASSVLTLPRARVGARCAPTGAFARDNTQVLQCVKGRWKVNMSLGQAIGLIDAYNRAEEAKRLANTPTTTAPPPEEVPPITAPAVTAPVVTVPPTTAPVVPTTAVPPHVFQQVGAADQFAARNYDQCFVLTGYVTCAYATTVDLDPIVTPGSITSISARNGTLCAVTSDHRPLCMGSSVITQPSGATIPTIGNSSRLEPAYQVGPSTAVSGSCFLEVGGTVACAMYNHTFRPAGLTDAVEVSGSCARRAAGPVVCWYDGSGAGDSVTTIAGVDAPRSIAARIEPNPADGCALNADRTVSCWTRTLPVTTPWVLGAATVVPGLTGVTDIAKSNTLNCAVDAAGVVRCWGAGINGLQTITGMPPIVELGGDDGALWAIDAHHEVWLVTGGPRDPFALFGTAFHWG